VAGFEPTSFGLSESLGTSPKPHQLRYRSQES